MDLGEFRKRTAHLPDNTDLIADDGTGNMWELDVAGILPPVLEHPYAVVLEMGQEVTLQLETDMRIDAMHGRGNSGKV